MCIRYIRGSVMLRRTVVLFPTFQLFLVPVMLIGFAGVLHMPGLERPDFILPQLVLDVQLPLLLTSYGVIAQLAPTVLAALYWRRATTAGAIAGLVAGALGTLLFFFAPALRPWDLHEGLLGLAVHVPVLVAVSLRTWPQPAGYVEAFVRP